MAANTGAYITEKWQEARQCCSHFLSEYDRQQLEEIESCEALQEKIPKMRIAFVNISRPTLMNRLNPCLESLREFLTLLAVSMGSIPIETAMIWGILSLVIHGAGKMSIVLTETIDMLETLAHEISIIKLYEQYIKEDQNIGVELVEIFVEIIKFWARAVHFLRRNSTEAQALPFWPRVKQDFDSTSKQIKLRASRLKEKVDTINKLAATRDAVKLQGIESLRHESDNNSVTPSTNFTAFEGEITKLQYMNISTPRNRSFQGREEELNLVRASLGHDPSRSGVKGFALWGTAGIGKTQIALAYAYEQFDAGINVILWIDCENGLSIAKSFAEIASMLELPSLTGENSVQNRHLVLDWIRKTQLSWLMILDNVEDNELAMDCWPLASHGSVLVTSQVKTVSIDLAQESREVVEFEGDEGAKVIMKLVNRPQYSDEEQTAARGLSAELGGHGLAIAAMAAQIKMKGYSIRDFLEFYRRNSESLHDRTDGFRILYKKSLRTCWNTAFKSLTTKASTMLGILSFTAPDKVPVELFKMGGKDGLPEQLSFCRNEMEFEDKLEELINTSLARQEPITRKLSIHRLIQREYRKYLKPEDRRVLFNIVSKLLYEAFPKQVNGCSLRNQAEQCKAYAQHVLALCGYWQMYKFEPEENEEHKYFIKLLTNCGWYFLESGAWSEEIELMKTAFEVCKDINGLDYAHLCNTHGCLEVERSNPGRALELFDKSLVIRKRLLGEEHIETANTYTNKGNAVQQAYRSADSIEEALELYQQAIEIEARVPEAEAIHYNQAWVYELNISREYRLLGETEAGLQSVDRAEAIILRIFGSDTHFDATAKVHKANLLFDKGEKARAEDLWWQASRTFSKISETHPATIAVQLKLSCLQMRRGEIEPAVATMRKLLAICELREKIKGDKGEIARVTRRLAEAMFLKKDEEEGNRLLMAAESMRREIQKDRTVQLGDTEMAYNILVWNEYW